jgi:hypothetical protein|nr:MAG TPA: hypothetical protein [Caudoviricetes sp.]
MMHENNNNENDESKEEDNMGWKDYHAILNDKSNDFSEDERSYLRNLLQHGKLQEFRKYYWQFIKQGKMHQSNKDDDFLKEQRQHREKIRLFANRLAEVEEFNSTLILRNENLESLNVEKEALLEQAVSRIKQLEASNSELQSRVQQERIDEKIPGYVDSVKSELSSDDLYFIKMSQIWAFCGCVFGLLAVCASFYTLYTTIDFNNLKGFELVYFFTRGLIGISILSWLAYICLGNSKKYTHESILRKDRRHALMFGQVFLQIYGSTSTKEDAVLVFKDWNMSGNSAFSDKTELPPGIQSLWDSAKEKIKPSNPDKSPE